MGSFLVTPDDRVKFTGSRHFREVAFEWAENREHRWTVQYFVGFVFGWCNSGPLLQDGMAGVFDVEF